MRRFLTVSAALALLFLAGCEGGKPAGGASAARKSGGCEGGRKCAEKCAAFEKRLAALEAKVAALAGSGGGPAAPAGVPVIGVPNTTKNTWKCVKVADAPQVDGELDDAAWKSAVQVKLVSDEVPPKRVANDSVVLICHDGTNFYIGAVCLESQMDKLKIECTKRDEKVYGDDCIEFYIDQQMDRDDAVKFVVNPNGVFMDFLRGSSGDAGEVTWNARVKTAKLKDRYVMEIAIPLKDMGVKYEAGRTAIGFNAYRMRQGKGKMGEYTTWWGECNKIDSLGKVTFE